MLALALVALGLFAELPSPTPPQPGDAAWRTTKVVDGVTLANAPSSRPGPWGEASGEIAAPIERVIAHLTHFEALRAIVPRLAELRVLEQHDGEAVVYFRFDLPWPVSDRDWTVRYRWRREGERWVMTWRDANEAGPPPVGGVVRVTTVRGGWELQATAASTTRGRYVELTELGGSLPKRVLEETSWKEPLGTFRGVRQAVGARAAR